MTPELEYLKDKIVIFDIDGTLTRYDFNDSWKAFLPNDWIKLNVQTNPYKKVKKTHIFDEIIAELGDNAWALTAALSSSELRNKIEVIPELYPTMRPDHILFVSETKYKIPYIEGLIENNILQPINQDKGVVLVDDKDELVIEMKQRYGWVMPFEIKLISDFI